jgi:ligand-binding sensor domain-containing protein/two-component sensor histidine kinase
MQQCFANSTRYLYIGAWCDSRFRNLLAIFTAMAGQKRCYAILWLVACLAMQCHFSSAQSRPIISIDLLDANKGLPQGFVPSIVEDKHGYIWLAGKQGLLRYDGYTFTKLSNMPAGTNSLGNDQVMQVVNYNNRYLFALGQRGNFDIVDMNRLQIRHCSNMPQYAVSDKTELAILQSGQKYYLVLDSLLYTISVEGNKNKFPNISFKLLWNSGIQYDCNHYTIVHGKVFAHNVSAMVPTNCIKEFDIAGKVEKAHVVPTRDIIQSVQTFSKNELLVCTDKRSMVYNVLNKASKYLPQAAHSINTVVDNTGKIWALRKDGICLHDPSTGSCQQYDVQNPLVLRCFSVPKLARAVCTDSKRNIWIATDGYGVIKINPNFLQFQTARPEEGASLYKMLALNTDSVIVLNEQYARYFLPKKNQFVSATSLQNFNRSAGLRKDKYYHNHLQFHASVGAIHEYNMRTCASRALQMPAVCAGLLIQYIDKLDDQTLLLIGTDSNLHLKIITCDNNLLQKTVTVAQGMHNNSSNYVNKAQIGYDSHYYISTKYGIVIYNFKDLTTKFIASGPGAAPSDVLDIVADSNRQCMWLGTQAHGLVQFIPSKTQFVFYTTAHNLPDNTVYQIQPRGKYLWISTNKGIVHYQPDIQEALKFTAEDGLQSNEFNRMSSCSLADGSLVFGGVEGLTRFFADSVLGLSFESTLNVTSVKIQQVEQLTLPNSHIKRDDNNELQQIDIHHNDQLLEIFVTLNDFANTGQCAFQYKIDGLQKEWVNHGNNNEITITNLAIGTYTLMMRGCNSKGRWSPVKQFRIVVHPPWYRTWWAITFFLLFLGVAIWLLLRYRIAQIKKVERLKHRISSDLHDEIGSSLTSLNIYNKLARKNSNEKGQKYLDRSHDILNVVIENLNDIVWSLNNRNQAADSVVSRLQSSAVLEALRSKKYNVHVHVGSAVHDVSLTTEQRKNLLLCIKEACNNCLKYASGTEVTIKLELVNKHIQAEVSDNGTGFDVNNYKPGNGVLNIQERMSAIGGSAVVSSTLGEGTSIVLLFPL